MSLYVPGFKSCTTEENLNIEVRELAADNNNSMDVDTISAFGSLFDNED